MKKTQTDFKKNHLIKSIRKTKSFNAEYVKKLSNIALEYGIINGVDYKEIEEDLKSKNGFLLCHAFNILLYRSLRGFNDVYIEVV